ncbi:PREDICTED: apicidin F cluster transcription factor apf2-like [Amphimedon queenslandica]|uniref:Uncharacterized protein n=1 Tax=Amphimedon queenslandica TaxID=400682 RepID=A0A1X7UP49_AMPQE|nr:PREDICTED: apicidin F cluster transcription factor apf2-like [Amphimedon queenslandica]|eukprot:XP_019853129.1 PREDICTED: apicidin F cluster transcription factor apf2-like [Amphimedon queenslandica]
MARRKADVAISMEHLGGGPIIINSRNATDKNGRTKLHRACMNSDYDKVAELLQKEGVNIIATDKNKSTPLHLACTAGNERIVDLLIKKIADRLAPALQRNFINSTDGNENTPLGIACYKGHTQVAELLLNHGADINHTNSQQV